MKFTILDWVASKGDGSDMEDLAGWNRHSAWLIDGATDLPETIRPQETTTGAKWMAGVVNDLLNDSAPGPGPVDLGTVAHRVNEKLGVLNGEMPPACSVAVAQSFGDQLLLTAAGDVFAYEYSTGFTLEAPIFGSNEANAMHSGSSTSEFLRKAALRRRHYIAGTDDTWILANNSSIRARTELIQDAKGPLLLMSDGFARLVQPYMLFESIADLAARVLQSGLQPALNQLRAFEAETPSENHYKGSDDAAAILLALEAES